MEVELYYQTTCTGYSHFILSLKCLSFSSQFSFDVIFILYLLFIPFCILTLPKLYVCSLIHFEFSLSACKIDFLDYQSLLFFFPLKVSSAQITWRKVLKLYILFFKVTPSPAFLFAYLLPKGTSLVIDGQHIVYTFFWMKSLCTSFLNFTI